MIRKYKIHTDLDGSDNRVFDMNDGKIRFYQPSDLGITTTTNIWKSDGIGTFGNSQVNHPQLDFKLETFGDSLEENYQIFNGFVHAILAKKFVTLEYTTSLGTFYADVKLAKVTKTEGFGFNGTFSEKISFDTITAWYTYQQLKFSKFENGEFNDNTKIYGNQKYEEDLNLITTQMMKDTTLVHPNYSDMPMVEVPVTSGETYTVSTNQPWEANAAHVFFIRLTSTNPVSAINGVYDGRSVTLPALSDKIYIVFRNQNFLNRFINGQYWVKVSKISERQRYVYTNKSYTYATEENIDRFSKWLIEENIFSFVARLTPSKNVENKKYGLRFLNADANEYSAIVFNLPQAADVIQINTDSNDEYYQAIFNGQAVNMFSALDFQRFRTRLFEKGSMELIGLESVEMNVKRKVDFV